MITKLADAVRAHFEAYTRRDKWPFFWRITIEGLLIPILLGSAIKALFHLSPRTDLLRYTPIYLFVVGGIFAPFFETLLLQALPVLIARKCGLGFWMQIWGSVLIFAAVHFPSGIATGITAGVFAGFYITFTYVHWSQKSFRSALWMTAGSHAIHNLVIFLLMVFQKP